MTDLATQYAYRILDLEQEITILRAQLTAAEQQLREVKDKLAVFEREIRRVEATPRNRRNIGEQHFIGWVANADGLGRDYVTALAASPVQPTEARE